MVEVVILSNNSCHFVISSECNNKWILKVPPEIFESCIIHDFFRFLTWFFSVLLYEIKHVSKCEQKNKFIISLTFMVYSWFIAWAPDNYLMYNRWIHQRCCQSKEIWHNFWWQHRHNVDAQDHLLLSKKLAWKMKEQ